VIDLDNDRVLVESTLKGDTESFSKLVLKYQDRVYSFLVKMTLSREDAEDILQDVFIKAYNNLYKYDKRWCFSTWLYSIAINTFKSHYKRKKRLNAMDCCEEIPHAPDRYTNPEITAEYNEQRAEIVRLIEELTLEQKTALVLKHIKGLSFKEIGHIMEISPEAAKMKVQRAKYTLCKKLDESRKRGVLNEM